MDVVFFETFKEEAEEIQKHLSPRIRAEFIPETIQESGVADAPAPLISIRTQSIIPLSWSTENILEGVLSRSAGYDHLLKFSRATGTGIPMGYLPEYCARSVAEHAVFLAASLLRKIPLQTDHFKTFNRDDITGREITGKNILVVGVGRIGSQVVDIASGLKMNVKGIDIQPKLKQLEYVSLEKGMKWADIIICALPLTDKTECMMNRAAFEKAKQGVVFINVSRGEISPLADLKALLETGQIGGLGMDVFEKESLIAEELRSGAPAQNELVEIVRSMNSLDNVIFTPHNAFNTEEALGRKAQQSAEAALEFLENKTFVNLVPQE